MPKKKSFNNDYLLINLFFFWNVQILSRDTEVDRDFEGLQVGSVESEEAEAKSSLLGRRGPLRRNSLLAERSRTVSAKKSGGLSTSESASNLRSSDLSTADKHSSLHDLSKSPSLMPPPRAPLGIVHNQISFV